MPSSRRSSGGAGRSWPRSSASQALAADRLDLTEVLPGPPGHLHLVTQVREELEDVFLGMGYEIAEGPEVETDWYNFTALNMPRDHPARSSQDSFYLDLGDRGALLLRSQTSPVQIRLLERGELPIYAVAPGRVYRRDTPDARHLPVFHQIEGLVVDRGVTFADLAGTIDTFVQGDLRRRRHARGCARVLPVHRAVGGVRDHLHDLPWCGLPDLLGHRLDRARRLRDGPSRRCSRRPASTPRRWTGFAFGFGIDRLAIMRHGIEDLRSLIENDVRFLTQF